MPLKRNEHWATRGLHPFLLQRALEPFAWGTNDCCLFPADAIKSVTGIDLAAEFRGRYDSAATAFALIKAITGGSTVADAAAHCAAKYGLAEWKTPLLAQRGDLVVIQEGKQLVAGVMHLSGRHAVTVGESGLKRFPHSAVTRAWHV